MTRIGPSAWRSDPGLRRVWDALPEARVVGGAVRDLLAHKPVSDFDLATPLPPEMVTAALTAAGIKVAPTGLSHGTVTAIAGGRGFEVTTLRRDIATDGRHATVIFTSDWREDAARRDFTINAMSMARDGEVSDYFNGVVDLQAGRIRFVGEADRRISEDYLRILRFFRFHARYGRQDPDATTQSALRAGVTGLDILSVERVWHELRLLLSIPAPWASIEWMRRLGVWTAVLPEAPNIEKANGLPADPILRIAAMLDGSALRLAERLKFSNEDRDRLIRLLATPSSRPDDPDVALRRLLADHDPADLIGRAWIDSDADRVAALNTRLLRLPRPIFPLVGRDVVDLGIPPGRRVGALLRSVRTWWLDGGCSADKAACQMELRRQACADP